MRKSLYIKFVISYLILAFIGFFAVSMFGSSMVHNHLDSVYSTSLYQEATNIAQNQASKYYREQVSLESVAQNLETLSKYQNVEIWLISKKGEILLNTASDSDDNKLTVIEDFNPGHSNGTYYQTGTFFNMFSTEHLSVMVPVTSQLNIQGYVAIHLPESVILNQQNQIMNIIYSLILIILIFCSFKYHSEYLYTKFVFRSYSNKTASIHNLTILIWLLSYYFNNNIKDLMVRHLN